MRRIINILPAEKNRWLREDRNDIVPLGNLVGQTVRNVLTNGVYFVEEHEEIVNCGHCRGVGECNLDHEGCWGRMDRMGPTCPSCGGSGEALKFSYVLSELLPADTCDDTDDVVEF